MSVRMYTPDEIEELYASIQGVKPSVEFIPDGEKLQMALWSALIANRAAIAMSYGEDIVIPRCELPKGLNAQATPRDVYTGVSLLLCNCITNSGRDYLPRQDRCVLESVKEAIARHAVEGPKVSKEVIE